MSNSAAASSSKVQLPPAPTPPPPPPEAISDADLEKLLNREASALQRELEVERILKAFKLNPYDILDIEELATPEAIKRRYRQLSLFIHPDKTPHERAPEAFDILKKAEQDLSDPLRRAEFDAVITVARAALMKELGLPTNTPDDDPKVKLLNLNPSFKVRLREESKTMLIDEEVRRRKAIKMNLANEGLEARKKDEEVASRKRKIEEDKNWEENRDTRVDSWRSFSNTKKKKKAKVSVLG